MTEQLIGDIAVEAIDKIMKRHNFDEDKYFGYTVEPDATPEQVMKYIWRYEGRGSIHSGYRGHRYRIDFYSKLIEPAKLARPRVFHIDIGCGGGTFTWALLEKCLELGRDFKGVRLYSYDYSPNMVKAARGIYRYIRKRHPKRIPKMHAYDDYRVMLEDMPQTPAGSTQYIITAGYVLANNLDQQAKDDFTEIISSVCANAGNNPCSLVVGDSSVRAQLIPSYERLVESLEASGVVVDTMQQGSRWRIADLS